MTCSGNNRAGTILASFMSGVETYVRSDKGLENVAVADFMLAKRGTGSTCMITGRSTHNQRIERLWRKFLMEFYVTFIICFTLWKTTVYWIVLTLCSYRLFITHMDEINKDIVYGLMHGLHTGLEQ